MPPFPPCKVEDDIAQIEQYYAAYPRNGVFPFTTSPLTQTAPLRLAYPNFIEGVGRIISHQLPSFTLVKSSAEGRNIVTTDRTVPAQSLCLVVTGSNIRYRQAAKEVYNHVLKYMNGHAFVVEIVNFEHMQGYSLAGLCLYSIERSVVLERNLEARLAQAVSLLQYNLGNDLISVGFYNSIFTHPKIVLGVRVQAFSVHDWGSLRSLLRNVVTTMCTVIFIPVNKTEAAAHTGFLGAFPRPPHIGSSIAAVGADQSGTLGAYFRLVNPTSAQETNVFLTNSHVIAPKNGDLAASIAKKGYQRGKDHGKTTISIQSPSSKDIESNLQSNQALQETVRAQLKRAQDKEAFERSNREEEWLEKNPAKIEAYNKTIEGIQSALTCPQDAVIGNVLYASTLGIKGKRESKMDWAVIEYTEDKGKIKNERPDINMAPRLDPRVPQYQEKSETWGLKKLEFNQWICFRGRTSNVRSGYTNGMRTFVRAASSLGILSPHNGSYEIEGLAGDIPDKSELAEITDRTTLVSRLASLTEPGDSGAVVWDEEGDIVGLLWGSAANQFGAIMTSIDQVVEDIKSKTGMDIEPL